MSPVRAVRARNTSTATACSRAPASGRRRETARIVPHVLVVAAALYDAGGRVLIAERPPGKHMAGRWEFPGGKVADGESERAALGRELAEELGIRVEAARPLMRLRHAYQDRCVELSLWIVERFGGVPQALDRQRLRWVAPAELPGADILEADRPFIEALRDLPPP